MKKLRFKPRATFNADLKRLASLDQSIIDEVRAAIDLLLEQQSPTEALTMKSQLPIGCRSMGAWESMTLCSVTVQSPPVPPR